MDIDGKGSAVKYFVSLEMVRQVETDIYFDVIRKNVILHNDITIILFLNRESEISEDWFYKFYMLKYHTIIRICRKNIFFIFIHGFSKIWTIKEELFFKRRSNKFVKGAFLSIDFSSDNFFTIYLSKKYYITINELLIEIIIIFKILLYAFIHLY